MLKAYDKTNNKGFLGAQYVLKPMKFNLRLGEGNYYLGVAGWCYLGPSCLRGLRVVLFGGEAI